MSSLAFVAAGTTLLARRAEATGRLVGWAAIAAGLGSVAYHGPGTAAGRYLHDASLIGLLAAMALDDAADAGLVEPAPTVLAGVPVAAAVLAHPRLSPVAQIIGGTLAIGAATARARRRGLRRRDVIGEGLFLGGAMLHSVGRTGGPLCRPEAPVPLHAVWHAAAAASVALRHG